jgi:hypothetical protein
MPSIRSNERPVVRRIGHAITVTALAVCCPTLAAAKEARPSSGEAYAQCVIERAPDFAERGLRGNWPSELFIALPRRLWHVCKRDGVNTNVPDLRYALAWGILRRNNLAVRPLDFSTVPPLQTESSLFEGPPPMTLVPTDQRAQFEADAKSDKERKAIFAAAGECVVRAKSEDTRALLLDPENRGKVDVLIPALQSCTPPNTQIALTRDALKGLLAWTYVRLALAVPAGVEQH